MAGRPKRQKLIHALTKRAQDEELDGDAHLEYLVRWTESGKTIIELTKELVEDIGEDYHTATVTRYFIETYGDEFTKRMAAARPIAAFAMVEQAQDIIDQAPTDDKIKLAKAVARAGIRQWTAERFNRRELGAPKDAAVNVNLSINTLHLDALRARSLAKATAKLAVQAGGSDTVISPPVRAFLSGEHDTMADEYVIEADSVIEVL